MLGRPTKATPTPDGKAVLFLRAESRWPILSLFEFDNASGKTRELLTPEQLLKGTVENLSPEEKARRERMRVSGGGFTGFQLSPDGKLILLSLSGRLYVFDRPAGTSKELNTGIGPLIDPHFSPDGTKIAYVRGDDIYVLDLAEQKERQVTTGGTNLVSHGSAEFIAQEEMNRFSGFWWSPDSKKIAFQETDARAVEVWYVADPLHPEQEPTPSFYPRPGKANVKVRLGIVSIDREPVFEVEYFCPMHPSVIRDNPKGKCPICQMPLSQRKKTPTMWIAWDDVKYPYLASVHWPSNGPLLLTVQNRDQTELVLLEADVAQGKTTPLLTERDPAWVNLHQDVPFWLNANGFLWVSERDGGPQLELRSRQGRLKHVLVPANQGFQKLVAVDAAGGKIVYNASTDPTQSHIFRLDLGEGSEPVALTKETGMHSAAFSSKLSMYVRTSRLLKSMPKTTVHKADDSLIGELPSVAEEPPFEPRVELVQVGKDPSFHAAVVLPRKFDAKKRYPVLVDVYGGPEHNNVQASQGRWLMDQWYADQGFIVVAIDGRGTPGRGRDWERAIKHKFGSVPLEDQVAGLQALGKRYPAMDLKRVGISGWSFGGYMSALAVLRRPDVFHAGIAGAPVCDWMDYDTHYTERYLGVPKDPAGLEKSPSSVEAAYKEGSLLTYAGDLKRPLLILHGTADDNVYFRHSLRLTSALFRNGKDFEILPLSGLTHMVPDPQVMENLHGRIARFLRKNLGAVGNPG